MMMMMMMMIMMMMKLMMVLKFVEHVLFHEKNSNNNLREERLPRFAIAWPLSQRIAKNLFYDRNSSMLV